MNVRSSLEERFAISVRVICSVSSSSQCEQTIVRAIFLHLEFISQSISITRRNNVCVCMHACAAVSVWNWTPHAESSRLNELTK